MKNILILFLFATQIVVAQKIESYRSAPFPTDLISAGDGKTIAWIFNDKGSRNIYAATAPAFADKKITTWSGDDGMAISNVSFTPDGNHIVFVKGNSPNTKGETKGWKDQCMLNN